MCGVFAWPILRAMDGTTTAISPETRPAGARLTGSATFAAGAERPLPCGRFGLIAALRHVPHADLAQEIR